MNQGALYAAAWFACMVGPPLVHDVLGTPCAPLSPHSVTLGSLYRLCVSTCKAHPAPSEISVTEILTWRRDILGQPFHPQPVLHTMLGRCSKASIDVARNFSPLSWCRYFLMLFLSVISMDSHLKKVTINTRLRLFCASSATNYKAQTRLRPSSSRRPWWLPLTWYTTQMTKHKLFPLFPLQIYRLRIEILVWQQGWHELYNVTCES